MASQRRSNNINKSNNHANIINNNNVDCRGTTNSIKSDNSKMYGKTDSNTKGPESSSSISNGSHSRNKDNHREHSGKEEDDDDMLLLRILEEELSVLQP